MKAFGPDDIILEMHNHQICISPDFAIPYSVSNIPAGSLTFRKTPTYWRVRKKETDAQNGFLKLEVLDYNDDEILTYQLQEKEMEIQKLEFELLDWSRLDPVLIGYRINRLEPLLYNRGNYYQQEQHTKQYVKPERASTYSDVLQVQFEKARFREGAVVFDAYIEGSTAEVYVYNQFLRLEFDLVKKWFIKKFDRKWFTVNIEARLLDRKVVEINAASQDIDSINETFIETFQEYYIKDLLKKEREEKEQVIKPIIDFVSDDDLGGSLFPETTDPTEVVKRIIKVTRVRNERELDFLSSHELIQRSKIQITKPPQIGFIFEFQTSDKTIFIWELLDSNATYAWSFNQAITRPQIIDSLNEKVSIIFQEKRMAYRRFEKSQKTDGLEFQLIEHSLKDENGFKQWESKVSSILR